MRLIEGAGQVHAEVRQFEAIALPPVRGMQTKRVCASYLDRLDRNQVKGVELVRKPEQRVVLVLLTAHWRQRGPRRILCGHLQLCRVRLFFIEPARDPLNVASLGERFSERFSSSPARDAPSSFDAFSGVIPLAARLNTNRRLSENNGASAACCCCKERAQT